MEPGTLSFFGFDSLSNIFQIFENDRATPIFSSFRYNLLSHTVVRMSNRTLFSAGDFPQALFSCLGTFALKALSMSQKLISLGSKRPPSTQLSCREGSQHIFSKIDADLPIRCNKWRLWKIENQVKKPALPSSNNLSFASFPLLQEAFVKRADLNRTAKSPLQSKKGKTVSLQGVGSLIEMDGASLFEEKFFGLFQSKQRLRCFCNRIAGHLRAQLRKLFSHRVIGQVMEFDPISLFGLKSYLPNIIARCTKLICKPFESLFLAFRKGKFDCNGSFHSKKDIVLFNIKQSKEEQQFLPALTDWVSLLSNG